MWPSHLWFTLDAIQKRLLSRLNLTFKTALETALSMEAAANDTLQMTTPTLLPTTSATEEVHQMADKQLIRKQGTKFATVVAFRVI